MRPVVGRNRFPFTQSMEDVGVLPGSPARHGRETGPARSTGRDPKGRDGPPIEAFPAAALRSVISGPGGTCWGDWPSLLAQSMHWSSSLVASAHDHGRVPQLGEQVRHRAAPSASPNLGPIPVQT